jgi:glycosyltransferase involved in cell wall biosynthesis
MNSKIVVFHPGTQHSHQTALAFQAAGLLAWYATEIFYRPDHWPYSALRFLPGRLHRRVEKELKRRYHPQINPNLVRTLGGWEWVERISMRFGLRTLEHYANEWGNISFGRRVAVHAIRENVDCVWGFDTASLKTFSAVRRHGIQCVLEQAIAHPRLWNRILTEERERIGYEFDPYPRSYPERDLQKVDAEIHLADQIVCGSPFVKGTMIEEGVRPEKLNVIPYGVDTDVFAPTDSPSSRNALRLLFVGHFGLRKGAWYLLEALKRLGHLKGLTVLVVGKQTVPSKFLSFASDKLRFLPHIPHDEIQRVYHDADVLVLPSLYEGSSITINEALASGLPVVTTPNSGSVVQDGVEGCVVPIRDVDALASKIELLYWDYDLRVAMGKHARQRALKLGWDQYGKGVVALWERMMSATVPEPVRTYTKAI